MISRTIETCLSGTSLYGDDFSLAEIEAWYEDEKEGYANLGAKNSASYHYGYHALNYYHGFRHLPPIRFNKVLGFGSAYGDEFRPVATSIKQLIIVDPSDAFVKKEVHGIPATYLKPSVSGRLPFTNQEFDLLTCLDVLHHIPNVTYVLGELHRCLTKNGFAVLREPVVSMGDWRKPRPGLTKRERGIPDHLFDAMIRQVGFKVMSKSYCMFPLIPRAWNSFLRRPAYNNALATRLDHWLSRATRWNLTYHATNLFKKLRPTVVYQVLSK